ncbi:MAG: cell division FtsA domain-containing protein [Porphyromonas sp.]|nr:cell division FtsA domain-containing protein [Porphyromonas sp.]
MNSNNVIAVIDLGSATSVGMIGYKDSDNIVHPTAYVEEPSGGCIRHGYVYNVDGTAALIRRIVSKLNKRLDDNLKIAQLYVGVGAQSLSSSEYTISRSFPDEMIISEDLIEEFVQEVEAVHSDGRETLMIMPPFFIVNGMQVLQPQGMPCREIEAVFQIVSARTSIRRNVELAVKEANLEFAGLLVSPIGLADITLSSEERMLGCCQIDLGAGCTSICIYKNGTLAMLQILPMGGANVTTDLTTLRLVEADAEALKLDSASMIVESDKEKTLKITVPDRETERLIKYHDIGKITSARMKEIVANIVNIIQISNLQNTLDAGMQIGGGGARLNGFVDYLKKELKAVYPIQLRRDLVAWESSEPLTEKLYTAIGLLRLGKQTCVTNERAWSDYVEAAVEPVVEESGREDEDTKLSSKESSITIEHDDAPRGRNKQDEENDLKTDKKGNKIGTFFGDRLSKFLNMLGDGDNTDNNSK